MYHVPTSSTLFPYTTLFRSIDHPFAVLDRFADEVERVFDDFGFGRSWLAPRWGQNWSNAPRRTGGAMWTPAIEDRKSTRLNSSHRCSSYAVFCLKITNLLVV